MTLLNKSIVADLLGQAQNHYARGNVVQVVTATKVNSDKDFGISGTITETVQTILPEPFINALSVMAVMKSGGAFRYNDNKMTISRDSLTEEVAFDAHTEFNVNGDRFQIITVTASPSAWEFIIRRKLSEPETP